MGTVYVCYSSKKEQMPDVLGVFDNLDSAKGSWCLSYSRRSGILELVFNSFNEWAVLCDGVTVGFIKSMAVSSSCQHL